MTPWILTSRHEVRRPPGRARERRLRLVPAPSVSARRRWSSSERSQYFPHTRWAGKVSAISLPGLEQGRTKRRGAFDQAIGLRPDSATALWGGALAHSEIGNKVIAQNYLRRTLVLQPTWFAMALTVPQLVPLLQISTRAADLLKVAAFGPFSRRPVSSHVRQTDELTHNRGQAGSRIFRCSKQWTPAHGRDVELHVCW